MCIKKLEYKFEENKKVRNCFKVMLIDAARQYHSPIFMSKGMVPGKWYDAPEDETEEGIRASERILPRCFSPDAFMPMPDITEEMHHYRRGFHGILSYEDAVDYRNHLTGGDPATEIFRIVLVQLKDITGTGYEDNPICRKSGEGRREMEVIVGTKIQILHEVIK